MICAYCGNRNNAEESRCRRCGRKPDDTLNGEYVFQQNGALASQLQPAPRPQPAVRRSTLARAVQRPLAFEPADSNVIAMPPPAGPPARTRSKSAGARPATRRFPRVPEEQGSLDFLPPAVDKPRTLSTTVEAVIYCEDPVASALHRAVAASLDWSMVLIGYGLFLGTFRALGGGFELSKGNLVILGAMLPLIAFTYGMVWALAGRETAGMRWTHLHLTTFDGDRPERNQFLLRFAGSCLSLCTLIGLLWSFADEESLAWQDHMSRTFPTPGLKSQRFLRR